MSDMQKESKLRADAALLVEDARALVAATGEIAEEKIAAARERLGSAVKQGQALLENVKDKAVSGAKATDKTIREHPYQALGVAAVAGCLLGLFLCRRR